MEDHPLTFNGYFGPPQGRKEFERQVATPVGVQCLLCREPIGEGDIGTIDSDGRAIHHACQMRAVLGSVGHQLKRCHCYGGNEEDPPGMSRYQAAQAALALWEATQQARQERKH